MATGAFRWPDWWEWELDTGSPHLAKRMRDRQFSETDLRQMVDVATNLQPNHEPNRWVVRTTLHHAPWEIIVEPLPDEQVLLVITAYPVQP
ncbi:MAG: DUF4258 domain-containing protein [Phycisphaerales bacterium]